MALEIREWEIEKSKGIERNLDHEILSELQEKPKSDPHETEPPPLPVEVVRF